MESDSSEWSSEVMCDTHEEVFSFFFLMCDASLHTDKGARGFSDFVCSCGSEVFDFAVAAELFCGDGEVGERAHLVSEEDERGGEEDERQEDDP